MKRRTESAFFGFASVEKTGINYPDLEPGNRISDPSTRFQVPATIIGVGAQLSLGGTTFLPEKYV